VDIEPVNSAEVEASVTLNGLTPTRADWPIESANNYLRTALLNEPSVRDLILDLGDLRTEWRSSPNYGKLRERSLCGEPFYVDAAFSEWQRYESAREASPLREFFSADQLDRLATIARERVEAGLWGKMIPVNDMGAGYGREKQRARAMTHESIQLAVADFVERLSPSEPEPDEAVWLSCPHCDAAPGEECEGHMHAGRLRAARDATKAPGVSAAAVRKVRQRARRLPTL
jgi:hypothetical protein